MLRIKYATRIKAALKPALILLFLFVAEMAYSQEPEVKPLKYKKIKKEIRKKRSPYYYPALYQRYLELDTSLSVTEFRYLYYGYTFQDDYRPYGTPFLRDSLINYLGREDLLQAEIRVAAGLAAKILKESPFRLRETFIAAASYEMAGNERLSAIYFNFYMKQVDAILSTGDGLDKKSAMGVIYIPDEYEIMEVLGFRFGGRQELLSGGIDRLEVAENPYGIMALYFDVSRMLEMGFD